MKLEICNTKNNGRAKRQVLLNWKGWLAADCNRCGVTFTSPTSRWTNLKYFIFLHQKDIF
jgi:hypothetical protein